MGEEEVAPRSEAEVAPMVEVVAAMLVAAKLVVGQGLESCQWGCQTLRKLPCDLPDWLQLWLWDCWRRHSAPQLED